MSIDKYEKALTDIVNNTTPYHHTPERVEHDSAIREALKKQIGMRIKEVELGCGIMMKLCPVCETLLCEKDIHCSRCGQKLDRSGGND